MNKIKNCLKKGIIGLATLVSLQSCITYNSLRYSKKYYDDTNITYQNPVSKREIVDHKLPISDIEKIVEFITPSDTLTKEMSENIKNGANNLETIKNIYEKLVYYGIKPGLNKWDLYELQNADNYYHGIQYLRETLEQQRGDCEDMVIAVSSLAKNKNINIDLLKYQGHILLMFEKGNGSKEYEKESKNLTIKYNDKEWIPINVAKLGKASLEESLKEGKKMYKKYKKNLIIIPVD